MHHENLGSFHRAYSNLGNFCNTHDSEVYLNSNMKLKLLFHALLVPGGGNNNPNTLHSDQLVFPRDSKTIQ